MTTTPVLPATVDENWSALWDRVAQAVPDRVAVVERDRTTTYRELEERAARLAAALHERGVGHGDRIGLFCYNRQEYLEAIYAAFKLGAIPVNINFRYRSEELVDLLELTAPSVLLFPDTLSAVVTDARRMADPSVRLVQLGDGPAADGVERYDDLLAAEPLREPQPISGADEIFIVTGGTTGTPKAVVWLHSGLFDSQLVSAYGASGVAYPTTVEEVVQVAVDQEESAPRTLPISPLMHAMAMFNTMNTLLLGGTVVFLGQASFDAALALSIVAEQRIDRVIIAGNAIALPLVDELDRARDAGTPYDASSVRLVMSSGMLWSDEAKARMLRHLDATLFDIVGASEGGPFAYSTVRSAEDLPTSLRLATGATLVDERGHELPHEPGTTGLLGYRGPMPLGYYRDPERTATAYLEVDGRRLVVPGDFARRLGGDRVEMLGRGTAVVNTGGEKVYPVEVEAAILTHDAVGDCVVFGVPDERWGSIVAAVVAPKKGRQVTSEEIDAHIAGRLAGYKRPRLTVISDRIDRSMSGKLNLRAVIALGRTAVPSREKASNP
ncbi:MAG TPA: AMP-binding protein [Cellulomonas sp.]|uniref:AMP-binding protein n=1 Tax=Cellulomonas sp. TaxID=40001 RepID=UPI002E3536D6|nr:AMP-binding protein [Cellulomonas sp.]HEX5332212.1 AMP-binding protein [Cellulomonas sp.]